MLRFPRTESVARRKWKQQRESPEASEHRGTASTKEFDESESDEVMDLRRSTGGTPQTRGSAA